MNDREIDDEIARIREQLTSLDAQRAELNAAPRHSWQLRGARALAFGGAAHDGGWFQRMPAT